MKYRATVIIAGLLLIVLAGTFVFGYEPIEVSKLENRRMTTFDMIFNPETDPQSEIYNAEKSHTDRFEDALKDQIVIRDMVVQFYSTLEGRLANVYNRAYLALRKPPVTPSVDEPAPNNPTEDTTSEDTTSNEPVIPEVLDFETYPTYGYQRLVLPKAQNYTIMSMGQDLHRINDTDYICSSPNTKKLVFQDNEALDLSITHLKMIQKKYPDMKIYTYFVRQACDTPWFDDFLGTTTYDRFEFVTRYLPENIKFSQFIFNDFEEYKTLNFASDHHWNYLGSRQGYEDVYEMMAEDLDLSPIKEPIKTWNFSELYGVEFRGSRASKLQNSYDGYDEFIVYEYDLGERECYAINPKRIDKEIPVTLCLWDNYKKGEIGDDKYYEHYIQFYGNGVSTENSTKWYGDSGHLFKIVNNNDAEHNLLIVGDSTQRAYRDVLASHFGTVIYMDYRIMKNVEVDKLIEKYDIDTLLIGTLPQSYWYDKWQYKFKFSSDFYK